MKLEDDRVVLFLVSGLLGVNLEEGKLAQIRIIMIIIAAIIPYHFHSKHLDFKEGILGVMDDDIVISCSNNEWPSPLDLKMYIAVLIC